MNALPNDITTHLQALFHSGQISGYVHSKLPVGPLKTGWIEQGLLSKGMKGKLRDKNNQESLVIPADRFARLARDRSGWHDTALVIIGPKGLHSDKFVAMVSGKQDSQSLIAFRITKTTPHEISQFLLKNALEKTVSKTFEEPNLDYIEQLRIDASEDRVKEMTVLSLPKKQVKMSEWMKEVLLSPSSESVEAQHGVSKQIPTLAALITRWLTGLELFKGTSNGIASLVFVGKKTMDVCLWDQPQRLVTFSIFMHDNLETLSKNYLTPLWVVPGERIESQRPDREVTVESRKASETQPSSTSPGRRILPSTEDTEEVLEYLSKRLEQIESNLDISTSDIDRTTMDALQSRLAENIERIETLSKRLGDLEKRLQKLRT